MLEVCSPREMLHFVVYDSAVSEAVRTKDVPEQRRRKGPNAIPNTPLMSERQLCACPILPGEQRRVYLVHTLSGFFFILLS